MKTIPVEISQDIYQTYEETARQQQIPVTVLIDETLRRSRVVSGTVEPFAETPRSVLDHPPISVGKVLKPLEPRTERIDDFFDRGESGDRN